MQRVRRLRLDNVRLAQSVPAILLLAATPLHAEEIWTARQRGAIVPMAFTRASGTQPWKSWPLVRLTYMARVQPLYSE